MSGPELPRPSIWPVTLAAGLTLALAGVVTSWIVGVAGAAIALLGLLAWVRDVVENVPEHVVENAPENVVENAPEHVVERH